MNIYVGNLPYSTEEADVNNLFAEFGEVTSVKLVKDFETGRLKGFGFVEIEEEAGQNAIDQLNGAEYNGRKLVVNEARPRESRRPNNFRGNNNRRF
jgi:RNA recognition motif-containing protein